MQYKVTPDLVKRIQAEMRNSVAETVLAQLDEIILGLEAEHRANNGQPIDELSLLGDILETLPEVQALTTSIKK